MAEAVPFDKRAAEAQRILAKYPDRVPIICEKKPRTDLPDIDQKKFLVPGTMLLGEFKYIIQKRINQARTDALSPEQTVYIFVGKKVSPKPGTLVSDLYEQYKSDDQFLQIIYSAEDTMGCNARIQES